MPCEREEGMTHAYAALNHGITRGEPAGIVTSTAHGDKKSSIQRMYAIGDASVESDERTR